MTSYTDEKLKNGVSPEMLDAKAVSPCMGEGMSVDQAIRIFDRMNVENWYSLQEAWKAIKADRTRLQAEVEALRKDAERYRYIRESGAEFVHYTGAGTHGLYEDEELDRRVDGVLRDFIDSARAKKGDV